ncbi:hypothetical protein KUTeg_014219 [Tegillarca granosa]|uniref:Uncharacterized protein n=1 Tax=Tegillarca granosa TaxID=220873 RepID=A0ABQ9F161_TEGGR|nr:hypothetical protein KUTeg_014219 [Tegillarca granosa]
MKFADEVEIDSHMPDPVAEVEGRLAKFRDQPSGGEKANNLNRGNSQENKPFEMNITGASGGDNSKSQSNEKISLEEMNKLIEQAAKEMEMDAQKALQDLQKDKEIMKKLQEIKSRKKEDVNKEGDDSKEENKEELSDSDNENEEELAKNLIKKLLEESKLEEAAAKDGINVESSSGSKNFVKQQNIDRVPSDKMVKFYYTNRNIFKLDTI